MLKKFTEVEIKIPDGVRVSAHEACAVREVLARSRMLYYPELKCVVPKRAEIIIEFDSGREREAVQLSQRIEALGWTNVSVEPSHEVLAVIRHDLGGEAGSA